VCVYMFIRLEGKRVSGRHGAYSKLFKWYLWSERYAVNEQRTTNRCTTIEEKILSAESRLSKRNGYSRPERERFAK
jgi:hypothetical protein